MPDNYFARYLPLLLHFLVAAALATAMVGLSAIFGYRRPNPVKSQAYECGVTPTGDARARFSVKFYLVAMLFILCDVEVVFLFPWAVIFRELGM
ncbi:MAG: NADH-quinone oxidoreductase subunit A, partial [Nevskiales bacterium]